MKYYAEILGILMAAIALIVITFQLGTYYRFGMFDEWVVAALELRSVEQFAVIAYLTVMTICLAVSEW